MRAMASFTAAAASPRFAPMPTKAVTGSRTLRNLVLRARRRRGAFAAALAARLAAPPAALARRALAVVVGGFRRLRDAHDVRFFRRFRRARRAHAARPTAPLLVAQLRHQVLAHRVAGLAELLPPVGEYDIHFARIRAQAHEIEARTEARLLHHRERRAARALLEA